MGLVQLSTRSFDISFPPMYGATAPSGPWPPSRDASIHPYFQLFSSLILMSSTILCILDRASLL